MTIKNEGYNVADTLLNILACLTRNILQVQLVGFTQHDQLKGPKLLGPA